MPDHYGRSMPKYVIEREIPGPGDLSVTEIRARTAHPGPARTVTCPAVT